MHVIYKCDHGPQVGYLWLTGRKLNGFSVMYNNIMVKKYNQWKAHKNTRPCIL